MGKMLVVVQGEWVAPRFDLATEVLLAAADRGRAEGDIREILLPGPSAEEMCGLIVKEGVTLVVCGGIEEEHYQYLCWKGVMVLDRVIAPAKQALELAAGGRLAAGAVLRQTVSGEGRP
ncbi:MAG: hypothetical protein AB1568_06920 [Thermodesulfobacteriota bacterium]